MYPEEVIAQFKTCLNKKEKDRVKQKEKEKEKEKAKATPPANGQFKSFVFFVFFSSKPFPLKTNLASMFLNSTPIFINAKLLV